MSGNITKRGKSWQLKFDVPSNDGKRVTRYATVRGSYADAKRELVKLIAARDTGMLPTKTAITVEDHVLAWIAGSNKGTKTIERWHQLARLQIIPHLGAIPLQKLTPAHVRAWHKALIDSGLSAQTIKLAHQLLRMTLVTALVDGVLPRNPTDHIKLPKVEVEKIEIVQPEAIGPMLEVLRGHALYPLASLALATGARRSELLALTWGDVNLDGKVLHIRRSVEETRTHGLRLKLPKSKAGIRTITLPPQSVALLRAHKVKAMEYRLALGAGKLGDADLVFCDANLATLSPTLISTQWHRAVRRFDLPKVTFHALRHTHASLLIAAGVDILTISKRLGHAKASVTLDTYAHLIKGADEAAADAIAGVL